MPSSPQAWPRDQFAVRLHRPSLGAPRASTGQPPSRRHDAGESCGAPTRDLQPCPKVEAGGGGPEGCGNQRLHGEKEAMERPAGLSVAPSNLTAAPPGVI